MRLFDKVIRDYVGEDFFFRGEKMYPEFIEYYGRDEEDDCFVHSFSIRNYYRYAYVDEVDIEIKNNEIMNSSCTCDVYDNEQMCQHIAACLIFYQDDLFHIDPKEKNKYLSKIILNEFYKPKEKGEIHLKKQVNLTVDIAFKEDYYNSNISFKFKIGIDKMYSLNNKLNQFLPDYKEGDVDILFGKSFTFNSKEHFFSKQDENIIQLLVQFYDQAPYYNFQKFSLESEDFTRFLKVLEDKEFWVEEYGVIDRILYENPLRVELKKDEDYKLTVYKNELDFLSNDCRYAIKDHTFYVIPEKFRKVLVMMLDNDIDELSFEESDVETFLDGVLPIVKDDIVLDQSVEDKFMIGIKPDVKIYLDLKSGLILADVVFVYKDIEVNYTTTDSKVIRDKEFEEQVVMDLLALGFLFQDGKIFLDDLDVIGGFLENDLVELAKKYEIFTSEKIKNTMIIRDSNVRSSFNIGKDNIMSFSFDLGDIKNDEVVNILESMKKRRKYYRLKNGDLVNLGENEGLKELENLVDDMELSKKDIVAGCGEIPKYRAIYLDSLKREKYHIIHTNNLFDELMNNFNSYKDMDVSLAPEDLKILRDYQIIGVKWLYNIYKCGFGGILADEMGLGKSIQFIYLIKQILKDKKDAKILIVVPTSLVYNWENEFNKFGSELNYKVLAEGKAQRKEMLLHIEDVNVLITTYGLVRQDQEQYKNMNFEVVALDEAQNIKNINAQMTRIVKSLKAKAKFALTGTPLENSVLELWSIFDFIMPGYLASQINFQKKYNIKDVQEKDLSLLDNLNRQIKPFILRRKKKDVVKELPEKIENVIYIDLNKEQKKLYLAQLEATQKEMEDIIASSGFKKGSFKILQLLMKLRQLCVDPRIVYENYDGGSAKIENLIEFTKGIIKNGHKVLLFTSFKSALDIVNLEFTNHNISTYVIDGSVKSKKRMELVEKFNQDDTNVFLITLKSGGTGLNLTSADVVIHLDLWWNPAVENQATDRAHRIGQKKTVEVVKLVCKGTIEERILELQNKKKILTDALIEGEDRDVNILSKLTEKDIKKLLSMDNNEEE